MCITFFGTQLLPGVKFLVAFNRDEYINRYVQSLDPTSRVFCRCHVILSEQALKRSAWFSCSLHGSASSTSSKIAPPNSCGFLPACRPTQNLHWWPDKPWVLAGRDTVGHGTWLGCSKHGRLAFLTNLRLVGVPGAKLGQLQTVLYPTIRCKWRWHVAICTALPVTSQFSTKRFLQAK